MNYPFTPKSNKKLKAGDYWIIELSDNTYAVGIVIDIPPAELRLTREIYVGLLDWNKAHKPKVEELINCGFIDQGHVHIKCIYETGKEIIGNIDLKNSNIKVQERIGTYRENEGFRIMKGYKVIRDFEVEDRKKYSTNGYWGYDYIKTIAEKIFIENDEDWV